MVGFEILLVTSLLDFFSGTDFRDPGGSAGREVGQKRGVEKGQCTRYGKKIRVLIRVGLGVAGSVRGLSCGERGGG